MGNPVIDHSGIVPLDVLKAVFDGMPEVIAIQEVDRNVLFFNQAALALLGKQGAESRRTCFQLLGCATHCSVCVTAEAVKTGKTAQKTIFSERLSQWLEIRSIPIVLKSGQDPILVHQIRDVSAQKREEERANKLRQELESRMAEQKVRLQETDEARLREIAAKESVEDTMRVSEANLRTFLNLTGDPILILKPDFTIFMANEVWLHYRQFTADQAIGRNLRDLVPALFEGHLADQFCRVVREGVKLETEFSSVGRRWRLVLVPVLVQGQQVEFVIAHSVDITVFREAEERLNQALDQEKKISSMKSRFISMVSHEFRTPMTAALMALEILGNHSEKLSTDKRQDQIHRIRVSLRRIDEMLEGVLAVNRIDSGKTVFSPQPVDLSDLINDILTDMRKANPGQQPVSCEVKTDFEMLFLDPNLIRQMMQHLLSNAWRFSPIDAPVRVILERRGELVDISVEDRGIGIPPEDQKRIFSAFERGTNVGKTSGVGLGLSIVKRLAQLHGGNVVCRSVLGKGTTFTVSLPGKTV